jgi:DNA-binding transcriptional MerR regulator
MNREGIGSNQEVFAIGQVGEMTDLEPYVLRYWETEFKVLQPEKDSAGNRAYTKDDIAVVLRIKQLLREEKYTIEGARQVFAREDESNQKPLERQRELLELRAFLKEVLESL